MHFVNEYYEIMTEHFTKRFIDHRGIGLAPQRVTEFPLHHGERGFDVRPLVVVLQKLIPLVHEEVVHLAPQTARIRPVIALEGDKGSTPSSGYGVKVLCAAICLVRRDFGNCEIARRGFDHRGKEANIVSVLVFNFHGGHDVRFHSAHEMHFDPFVLLPHPSVFVVKPAMEAGSGEAGRIHGKVFVFSSVVPL